MEKVQININYEFRGYRLLAAEIKRDKLAPIKSITLTSRKRGYDEKNQIFEMVTEVVLTFGDETSKYVFSSGYHIVNAEWIEVMAEQTVINEFTQVFYPYLREKLFEFTSDFRAGLLIPCMDLKQFDFTKVVTFNIEVERPAEGKIS